MEITPSDVIKTLPRQEFSLVFQKVKEMEKTGAHIINLGQGNPDLPTPPHCGGFAGGFSESFVSWIRPFQGLSFFKGSDRCFL